MVDLISFPGGKKPTEIEAPEPMSLVSCANCGGGLFNWRVNDEGGNHLLGCAMCGYQFPILDATVMDMFIQDLDDE